MEKPEHYDETVHVKIQNCFHNIRKGNLIEAETILESILTHQFDDQEIISALKCLRFWKERFDTIEKHVSEAEKAEYLIDEWKRFGDFISPLNGVTEQCIFSHKVHVFGTALEAFLSELEDTGLSTGEIQFKIGRCYKNIGDYDNAKQYLEKAAKELSGDSQVLCELADCYAFLNENQFAKAFFREAFYIDPQKIELFYLESEMISRLVSKVMELGYNSTLLKEWIPVYGVVYGIFSVKRELRSIEYGKLKQAIYSLEIDLKNNSENSDVIIPRLLYRYFWLIDHYILTNVEREKIQVIMGKINLLDRNIYELYTN